MTRSKAIAHPWERLMFVQVDMELLEEPGHDHEFPLVGIGSYNDETIFTFAVTDEDGHAISFHTVSQASTFFKGVY